MSRIYVGNVDPHATERDLEDEFRVYGVLRSVWVARKPPGFAFVEFEDRRDASDAIRGLDGKNGWRVELSRSSGGGPRGGGGRGGDDMKCYECGEPGHFARECRLRIGPGGMGSGVRARSRSPRYRRSPSYGRSPPRGRSPKGSRSPRRGRSRYSPERERPRYSPERERERSRYSSERERARYSVERDRSVSRSPPPRKSSYKESPPANGSPRERRHERSISP